jgi:serine protease Do
VSARRTSENTPPWLNARRTDPRWPKRERFPGRWRFAWNVAIGSLLVGVGVFFDDVVAATTSDEPERSSLGLADSGLEDLGSEEAVVAEPASADPVEKAESVDSVDVEDESAESPAEPEAEASPVLPGAIGELLELERATTAVIESCKPGFVFIGGGSGFSISPDGYVLTNHHVIEGATELQVTFTGGRTYMADVAGTDPHGDVALLLLRGAENVPYLELGNSDAVRPGERVVALGDPFLLASQSLFLRPVPPDFEPSASMGIVSAVHRYSDTYSDAIQVDLAVNRGNSGGPLLSLDGKVLGINGKIETRFALGINTGVGYAIPANQIRRFLEPMKIAGGGQVSHGTIVGLSVAERADDKAGLPVTRVVQESPADRIGFEAGDLLLTIGGLPARTATRFHGILSTYPEGDTVTLVVARGEETVELAARLVATGRPYLGIRTRTPEDGSPGVEITRVVPGSPAARAGLAVGDVVLSAGGSDVTEPRGLQDFIARRLPGDEVVVRRRRGTEIQELTVRIGSGPVR